MIVYLDVDQTLFNTQVFKTLVAAQITAQLAISPEVIQQAFDQYSQQLTKNTDFDPVAWQAVLGDMAQLTREQRAQVQSIWWQPELYQQALFDDTLPMLQRLQAAGVKLGIYSEATMEWQTNKLVKSGIMPFIDQSLCHIAQRKATPEVMAKLESQAWVIDDNPEFIAALTLRTDLRVVWLKRPGFVSSAPAVQINLTQVQVVANLDEFTNLVLAALT